MGGLSIALLVLFVIICAIIIFLILLQNEEGDSLGGLFAGGSNSAFGSKSGNVLTKATYIVVTLFFVTTFLLAFLNKSSTDKGLSEEVKQKQAETSTEWWKKADNSAEDGKKEDAANTETKTENSSDNSSEKSGE
ncbi:preprotein translocase subunit SecG [Treponema pedis]|uniref:Protein-export membrane protein SecG n=1 Tax=Treponema pedis TaxID=409322 RepID=A0A7S7AY80_9SPIR|nr:preprotein translocase subunit SecG [Treponema pedis]QOW61861.1 preprotein translocase subunit SecG [Treponema pedis]